MYSDIHIQKRKGIRLLRGRLRNMYIVLHVMNCNLYMNLMGNELVELPHKGGSNLTRGLNPHLQYITHGLKLA